LPVIQHADSAFLQQQKILSRQRALKTIGKVTGTDAAIGVVGGAAKAAKTYSAISNLHLLDWLVCKLSGGLI
jgi:hypothetical protein